MSEEPVRGEGSSPARAGEAARQLIRRTRQVTRRKFPAEEKIRIVLEGIRGEVAVSELCRREGIHPTIYYKWLKDFMEAGKGRLRGDTKREATSEEVRQVREENERLKQLVTELSLANLTLKKACSRAERAAAVCAHGSGAEARSDRTGAEVSFVEGSYAGRVGYATFDLLQVAATFSPAGGSGVSGSATAAGDGVEPSEAPGGGDDLARSITPAGAEFP